MQAESSGPSQTRALLICGVIAGPLLVGLSFIQAFTRPGFDLARHPISLLGLGNLGWLQIANFEITGLLFVACAVGIRQALRPGIGCRWGPLLFAGYGLGLIAAGIFTADPSLGFPPGAPAGVPPTMSWHSALHGIAFSVSMVSLIAACFVFARRFWALAQRGWAAYCIATAVAAPVIIFFSARNQAAPGGALAVLVVATGAWVTAIPARLLAELAHPGMMDAGAANVGGGRNVQEG